MKNKFQTAYFVITLFFLFSNADCEDAADLRQKGIDALKDSQTNPDSIVTAARCFAKASAQYVASGENDGAVEMNSFLYWCKKKMTMAQIDSFLTSGETVVTKHLDAASSTPIPESEAQALLDRATTFERANTSEPFLVSVRYFEVADRFKDTDVGRAAMAKSLQIMQKVIEQQKVAILRPPVKVAVRNAVPKKVNLLSLIDPSKDSIEGKWQLVAGALISDKGEYSRLSIPYMPPEEYDLSVEFTRLKGNECVQIILSKSGHQFMYVLGGDAGKISGFDVVNGKGFKDNDSGYRGKVIVDGKKQNLVIKVRNDGVTAILDGRQLSHTSAPFEKMTMRNDWRIRRKGYLALAIIEARMRSTASK